MTNSHLRGHINQTHTVDGISDQYVYGDGRYVDLRDGIVTSIQDTGMRQ
jgi:hypothetical protein